MWFLTKLRSSLTKNYFLPKKQDFVEAALADPTQIMSLSRMFEQIVLVECTETTKLALRVCRDFLIRRISLVHVPQKFIVSVYFVLPSEKLRKHNLTTLENYDASAEWSNQTAALP